MARRDFIVRSLFRTRASGCQSSLLHNSSVTEQTKKKKKKKKDEIGDDSVHVYGSHRIPAYYHSASDRSTNISIRSKSLLDVNRISDLVERKAGIIHMKIAEPPASLAHNIFCPQHTRQGYSGLSQQVVMGHGQHCRLGSCFKFHHASLHLASDNEGKVDPFSLVADELSSIANRLRAMVSTEVPKLASAAEYFFKIGVEGKRFRPMILLLMASSMTIVLPDIGISESTLQEQQLRQQRIAEITEMIHVASLLHDDVLDSAETRRGIGSLNFVMGNKLAVLAGDFLLSRASVSLASLKNTEVVELLSKVLEHLVTGEIMQLTSNKEKACSMEYYLEKTFYKTASLMANSCKAIALLAGQSSGVATLAYDYGRHLGMAFQLVDDMLDFTGTTASLGKGALSDIRQGIVTAPLLFALEQQPQLLDLISRKFKNPGDVELAVELLKKTDGMEKTRRMALEHATQAAQAIHSLPPVESERARKCRQALVEVTEQVLTRTK